MLIKSVLRPCSVSGSVGQIRKNGGGFKNAYISRNVGQIDFKLGQKVGEGVPYNWVALFSCQWCLGCAQRH